MKRSALRLLPGLLVSGGFLYWFLDTAQWAEVGQSLAGVSLFWVIGSALVLFTEFFLRSLRWKVLLGPLRTPEGLAPRLKLGRLFVTTVIGMSLNVVLPFRAGDFARPFLGSRETGIGIAPLVTIAVMERVFDILGLVSVLLLMVLTLPADAAAHGELVSNLKIYGGTLGILGVCGLSTMFVLAMERERARGIFETLAMMFPGPLRGKVLQLYEGLADGLEVVRNLKRVLLAMLISLMHWLNGAISIFLLFKAFAMPLPFSAACFTTVAIALAAALPQAPAFVGVFHAAIQATLELWGMPSDPAKAYAILFWAVSFVPIAIVGVLLFWREGLSLSDLRSPAQQDKQSA